MFSNIGNKYIRRILLQFYSAKKIIDTIKNNWNILDSRFRENDNFIGNLDTKHRGILFD